MPSSRFFVTNLPLHTTESELRSLFKDYGPVSLVDLKTKENALDPQQVNVFAFVTLEISSEDAEYYINELKWKKLRGAHIKISLAKESFLERLKRERETGENIQKTADLETKESTKNEAFPESLQNTRRVFAENEDIDDDISADLLITKKRAARSMQNGKVVIEESGVEPLHVIEKQKKTKHESTPKKTTNAEQKRKESINKMKNQYEQKKNVIKDALSGLNNPKSTKIKFSDAEEEEEDVGESRTKTNIFGMDDENDEDITDLKLHYGKKGDKLAKLKSQKQTLDPRFKIDEKFVDDDDEDETVNKDDEKSADSETDERKWQLGILEQVVGYKLDKTTAAEKAAKNKKMVRYDPSKTEHEKLLRQKASESKTEDTSEKLEELVDQKTPPVSRDVFYVVSDTFNQALKTRGEGFSLLNMFGSQATSAELEQREDHLNQLKDERILVKKLNKNAATAIQYESSSSGEDDEASSSNVKHKSVAESKKQKQNGKKGKVAVIMETFFFNKNDERLREGALFFQYDKLDKIAEEDYEPVRRKLNSLIKKKIVKTRKNQLGAGRKRMRNKKKV